MAVMKPKRPTIPVVEPAKATPQAYEGVTVDSKHQATSTLTTFLEGQAWSVDYYSQIKDRNDGLTSLESTLPAVYQSYKLIRGFEFKVISALQPSQSSESKEMSLVGSANVYSVLIPNEGDMFIADVGDGREGLFTITSTSRKSIYKETAHEVEYKMVSYNTAATRSDLDRKVIDTLYFDRDYLRTGNNPLLTAQTVDIRQDLTSHYTRLLTLYFNDFYSREVSTLLVPNQRVMTYDPFIVRFITTILSTDEHPYLRNVEQLNVSEDALMYELTFWQCLERMDYSLLPMVVQEMNVIPVTNFFSMPMFNSIYYSKVRAVVYPDQKSTNVDASYIPHRSFSTRPLDDGKHRFSELARMLSNNEVTETDLLAEAVDNPEQTSYYKVTHDDYYVLSKAFYTDGVGLSQLEYLVMTAMKGEAIDLVMLDKLCREAIHWPNLERFYFIPLLLTLLKVYPRSL